jgi:hypothetical protein
MTKFIVDGNNNYSTDDIAITNVTLPLSKLINCCQSYFKCCNCHSVSGKSSYTVERYGVASSLYFECLNCNLKTGCRATLTKSLEAKWLQKSEGELFKDTKDNPVNPSDFDLNNELYPATQQGGGGLKEASTFGELLGLHLNPLKGRWREMGDRLGIEIIQLGKEIVFENVSIEMELSETDEMTGGKNILACGDC